MADPAAAPELPVSLERERACVTASKVVRYDTDIAA